MFKNKNIILGVTGSIAAYKSANLAGMLIKKGCNVHVIMTKNATNIINPITFEELTKNKCIVDTFDRNFQHNVAHISIAEKGDVFIIAPASANIIGKIASGIADDMLTTTIMAAKCTKIIAPAMNTNMFENSIVQNNLKKLRNYGYIIIPPEEGLLACGTIGKGRLPKEKTLIDYIEKALFNNKDLEGKKILVTAGPTQEAIDPIRYITNYSSGKMGYAIARAAMLRGADVTLVSGPVNLEPVPFVKTINVKSAEDMFKAVDENFDNCDIVIKAAAVADYTPVTAADNKIKKSVGEMSISLKRTTDIIKTIGTKKTANQFICGFSMETENMIENSRKKLESKNMDIIVCNNLKEQGAGFNTDTNKVTVIDKDSITPLKLMSKDQVAHSILDIIVNKI